METEVYPECSVAPPYRVRLASTGCGARLVPPVSRTRGQVCSSCQPPEECKYVLRCDVFQVFQDVHLLPHDIHVMLPHDDPCDAPP